MKRNYLPMLKHFTVLVLITGIIFSTLLFVSGQNQCTAADPGNEKTRPCLSTGPWYPKDPGQLKQLLDSFFNRANSKKIPGKITGLISPHAGLSYSGQCAANGFKHLQSRTDLERVFLFGVSHRTGFYGAAVSDFHFNQTPLGNIPIDTNITAALAKEKFFSKNNRALQYEHSIENQLPFLYYVLQKLNKTNGQVKIIPILFSRVHPKDYPKIAAIIKKYVNDKTVIIASTDLTHYGQNFRYTPFKNDKNIKENLTKLDMGIINPIKNLDIDAYVKYLKKTGITMCGFTPVAILMSIFKDGKQNKKPFKGTLIDYYKSGDRNNDYALSVSYASIAISQMNHNNNNINNNDNETPKTASLTKAEKSTLLAIARQTLKNHFDEKSTTMEYINSKYTITEKLKEKAGVFVTLKIKGRLRGCIGTIIGVEPLVEAVRNNVLKSAFQDHRFYPLKKAELNQVDIDISVMTPLQQITDYKKIRLGTDGVIIRKNNRQSVYLPQVATETGWNLDQFLSRLSQKAGLPANAYKSKETEFHIFQALVFGEKDEG